MYWCGFHRVRNDMSVGNWQQGGGSWADLEKNILSRKNSVSAQEMSWECPGHWESKPPWLGIENWGRCAGRYCHGAVWWRPASAHWSLGSFSSSRAHSWSARPSASGSQGFTSLASVTWTGVTFISPHEKNTHMHSSLSIFPYSWLKWKRLPGWLWRQQSSYILQWVCAEQSCPSTNLGVVM